MYLKRFVWTINPKKIKNTGSESFLKTNMLNAKSIAIPTLIVLQPPTIGMTANEVSNSSWGVGTTGLWD